MISDRISYWLESWVVTVLAWIAIPILFSVWLYGCWLIFKMLVLLAIKQGVGE